MTVVEELLTPGFCDFSKVSGSARLFALGKMLSHTVSVASGSTEFPKVSFEVVDSDGTVRIDRGAYIQDLARSPKFDADGRLIELELNGFPLSHYTTLMSTADDGVGDALLHCSSSASSCNVYLLDFPVDSDPTDAIPTGTRRFRPALSVDATLDTLFGELLLPLGDAYGKGRRVAFRWIWGAERTHSFAPRAVKSLHVDGHRFLPEGVSTPDDLELLNSGGFSDLVEGLRLFVPAASENATVLSLEAVADVLPSSICLRIEPSGPRADDLAAADRRCVENAASWLERERDIGRFGQRLEGEVWQEGSGKIVLVLHAQDPLHLALIVLSFSVRLVLWRSFLYQADAITAVAEGL